MKIENNSVVSIEYNLVKAKDENKETVDSNVGGQPLVFLLGRGQIIPGLEEQLVGMSKDDEADILVEAEKAYGSYNDEAIQQAPIEQFAGIELKEGMSLYGQSEDGQTVMVTVKSFDDKNVSIDYNHPLAGEDLMFSVKVLAVREATAEEMTTGNISCGTNEGQGSGGCGTGCGCH